MSMAVVGDLCRGIPVEAPPQNKIRCAGNLILNNDKMVRIAMTRNRIRIGCTEISYEAARKIMDDHRARFAPIEEKEYVMQEDGASLPGAQIVTRGPC